MKYKKNVKYECGVSNIFSECPGCKQKFDPDSLDWHLLNSHEIRKVLDIIKTYTS